MGEPTVDDQVCAGQSSAKAEPLSISGKLQRRWPARESACPSHLANGQREDEGESYGGYQGGAGNQQQQPVGLKRLCRQPPCRTARGSRGWRGMRVGGLCCCWCCRAGGCWWPRHLLPLLLVVMCEAALREHRRLQPAQRPAESPGRRLRRRKALPPPLRATRHQGTRHLRRQSQPLHFY